VAAFAAASSAARDKFFIMSLERISSSCLWILCSAELHENFIRESAFYVIGYNSCCFSLSVSPLQGQYFSGGHFRIYLLGNPIIWWSNLVFLALFLLTYFMTAIKRQRGYEKLDSKGE